MSIVPPGSEASIRSVPQVEIAFPISVTLTAGPDELTDEQRERLRRRGIDETALVADRLQEYQAAAPAILEWLAQGTNLEAFKRDPVAAVNEAVPDLDLQAPAIGGSPDAGALVRLQVEDDALTASVQELVTAVLRAAHDSPETAERLFAEPRALVDEIGNDQPVPVQQAATAALATPAEGAVTGDLVQAIADLSATATPAAEPQDGN